MRIVAGKFGSRVIQAVEGQTTRPTTDKVKEAIFSRIGPYFDGGSILDLFAGSGAISLEAISRGMEHAVLVDMNGKAISTITSNIKALGVRDACTVLKMDYKTALHKLEEQKQSFDVVFLDLQYLDEHDMVKENGDVICESLKEDIFEDAVGSLQKVKDVTYGITRITYYRKR